MARTPFPMSISKVNDMLICKEVRCCCIYDNQTLKISIFCSYYCIIRRLCSVRHPSVGFSKCHTFCTFEIWEIWHFCVKVSNIATNFVVKRCKYKYWIAFCRCSRVIWIASERKANFHAPLMQYKYETILISKFGKLNQMLLIVYTFWKHSYEMNIVFQRFGWLRAHNRECMVLKLDLDYKQQT